jgi:hypothetical protein
VAIPKRIHDRVAAGLKRFLPILEQQRSRDISEADTVTLVKDMLSEIFGYDKYTELTGEYAIRGTYCDLAVKFENKLAILCEVKAIGMALDDRHVKQAIDYAANQGCEWVILTNAVVWRLYHVQFAKPIDKKLIVEFDVTALNLKNEHDQDKLYALTKEGFLKGAHIALKDLHEATSRHLIGALLVENTSVLQVIRRELRRVVDALVDETAIKRVLIDEVIKRDVLDGEEWKAAVQKVNRREAKALRPRRRDGVPPEVGESSIPSMKRGGAASAPSNPDLAESVDS